MDTILDYLKQLDLSDEEASIYVTLLQTGPVSVKSLAEEVDIKRTTAYIYINTLINKGLIVKVVKGAQKMVAANDPKECLEDLVKRNIQKAKEIKKNFPDVLASIAASSSHLTDLNNAEVRYYKGKNNIKKIYEEALQSDELRTYVKLEEDNSLLPEDIELFRSSLEKNKQLVIREIFYNSPLVQDKAPSILSSNKRYFFKVLPKDLKLTSGDILLYNDTVAIINYQGEVTCVVHQNKDFYNTLKELFDFIWKTL
jgi:sugar-specific transcriptional regulator TrmB